MGNSQNDGAGKQVTLWGDLCDAEPMPGKTYTRAVVRYKTSNKGIAAMKRDCERKKHDKYGIERAKRRERRLKEFGLTPEGYHGLLVAQEWKCAICHEPLVEYEKTYWPVDHCHKTGKVRGIVHAKCNSLVGWIEKNERLLPSVFAYIRRHRRRE